MGLSPASILYDANGNPIAATPASALASTQSALVTVGSDYATTAAARIPKVDVYGQQYVVPSTPGGASAYVYNGQTPPAAASQYGMTINALQPLPTPVYLPITLDPTGSVNVHEKSKATFRYIVPTVVGGAAGKSMFSIVNGSASTFVRIQQVNIQTPYTYTTGGTILGLSSPTNQSIAMLHEMRRITAHTKGTSTAVVTFGLADSADVMDTNVVAYTNATVSGAAAAPFHRADANSPSGLPWYLRGDANQKTLCLRPGEGASINTVSTTTSYTFDLEIIVTAASA
jgi:hypothetical protein